VIVFFALDILAVARRDVRLLPLSEREQFPRDAVRTSDLVQVSESFRLGAAEMIALVERREVEGAAAKRLNSLYEFGRRSGSWVKVCLTTSQEFVGWLRTWHTWRGCSAHRLLRG